MAPEQGIVEVKSCGDPQRPLVSVVVPTHNRAGLLRRAVGSVLGQTRPDWELIVVDDASTDATPELVERFAATDARIRLRRLETPGGAPAARNRGIALARGRYVAFLDDDAEWLPEKLARQVAVLEDASRGAGLVYCPLIFIDADGRRQVVGSADAAGAAPRRTLLRGNSIDTSCVVVRRDLLDAVGGFDEALPRLQDWDLWVRLAGVTGFGFVAEPFVRGYFTPGSISTRSDALVAACRRLASKFEEEISLGRDELADWHYALGHALMIGGAPREGRRLLRRAVGSRPWPPRRVVMASLAVLGARPYGIVSALHRRVAR